MITIRSNSNATTTNTAIPKFIKANVNNHFIDLSIFIIIPSIISTKTTTTTIAIIKIILPAVKSERMDAYSTVYLFKPLFNLRRYLCYNLDYHQLPPS